LRPKLDVEGKSALRRHEQAKRDAPRKQRRPRAGTRPD